VQEQYESANRMEAKNPEEALKVYRGLATGSGPWAANALYAAGRLQADRGRKADAQRLLNDYLTRYPNGANARDARDLLDKMR
jgi:TolA-binding protein